jgi:trimeric autotransporter adhesin
MKKITKLVLGCLLLLLIGGINTRSNAQAITNGGFETGSISPWTGTSLVTVSTGFTELSWTIVPSGTGMARIEPSPGTGVLLASAESNLGLASGSLVAMNSSIFGSGSSMTSTNFGTMTQTITLAAGQTIVAYWNYVSRDYTPFNDGFMATLVGPSYQQVKVLAMTANAYGTGAIVTGSYGSTGWYPVTFTAGAAGTYKLGFACWNAGDQGLSPIVSIDNAAGGTSAPGAPIVTTSTITATSCTTATCGGNVTSDGGTFVTAKGVCWNTAGSPTLADSHTTDGTGTGSFTSSITGLGAGTYYVKTYATNSVGTTYGPEVTIATSPTISGTLSMCTGGTTSLTASGSGTWSSMSTSVATVDASGIVSGITAGTAEIRFTTTGCEVSAIVTVNASPSITGTATVCVGSTTTLSAGTGGGSWISGSTGVATVVSGEVTGVSAGTAVISYYNAGCLSTATVTVNALPSITTEVSVYICPAATYTLTASPSGGTWGSSDVAAATVGMTSGIVTGVATGSTSISYTVAGCVSEPFHVGVLPATEAPTVEGASTVCVGSSISLSSSTESGSWSSSNTSVATVEGGMVYGVSGGTAAITYSVTGDCGTAIDAHIVTVISLPAPISGPSSVCAGSTITLTSSPAGGTWSTGSMMETGPAIAISDVLSVDESTGVVTGVTAGTATVTYTAPSGCYVTTDITVEELPEAISGTTSVCVGSTTPLSSAPGGGTWTSSNTSRATVDGDAITPGGYTALVTGVSPGTVSISYTLSTGCRRKVTVTVLATPAAITGSSTLCSGGMVTLSSATTGGSWSSSDDGVASIDASTGIVTGTGTGTATIMYTIGGCSVSTVVTVAGSLTASTGSSVVCVGGSIALSNTTSGGAWSSSDVAIATVTSSGGVVTGVSSGVVSITYTAGAGCYTITNMTVNAAVSSITGTMSVCPGLTTTLSNATSGGSWSSSNGSVATVDAGTGVVTGVSGGTVTISYIVSAGCSQSAVVTVLSSPAGISGTAVVCEGSTTTLTCSPGGGTWSSSGSAATVGSTGIVTGISAGSANVYYTNASGCSSAITVTVNAVPASITGTLSVCVGSTSSLSSTTTGGTWVATFPTRATVNSTTGLVTGLAAGTTPVIYTAGGCSTTSTVTVSSTPSAIGGTLTVCIGSTTTLTSATTGGTWTSSNGSVATIVSGTGVVTGVGTGAATIAYSNGTCATTAIVTVNSALGANTGVTTVCAGSGTTLSNATTGGTWSTSNASVATVNTTTGLVAGVSGGTVNISYNVGAGCFSVTEVTVNTSLSSITGTTTVCPGATTTLSHGDAGGAWSSGNTARATVVSGTGVVTGVTTGTVFITYTLGGCFATTLVSVNASPGAITGTASMCTGLTTALSSSPSGGTWSSASPATASISGGGVVTGVMAGTATISYQNAAGCVSTRVVTVSASAGTIGGTLSTCIGTTTTLTAAGGGTWSSANTLRATIGSATGIATGVSAGTVIVSYALSASCVSTAVLTVTAVPSITGTALICAICTSTLTGTPSGGTWTSSVPARATIGASSGIVSGVSAGTTTMSYVAGGCLSTRIVTVNPSTSPSFGTPVVCVGQTNSTLSNPVPGGTWSSSNPSIVTVHAANGLLTGVAVGNANITYQTSPGSWTIIVATVGALVAPNVGATSICPSTTSALTNATAGGTWLSSNTIIATVGNTTGIVTGVTSGTASISYEVNVGCYRVSTFNIKNQPNIGGTATTVPIGATRILTGSPGGGTWSSANIAIATVSGTGVVGGVSVGGTTITYTNSAAFGGCFRTRPMSVTLTRPGGPVVGEAAQPGVLKIFPNPTSGSLTIDAPVAGTFTVYTIDGKEVAQYAVTASANMVTLPSNLAAGIYMSRFMGSDGTSTVVRLVYEQK